MAWASHSHVEVAAAAGRDNGCRVDAGGDEHDMTYDDDALDPSPEPASKPPPDVDRRLFGDVFSGTGGFGSAVAQPCGVESFYVDMGISSKHDLRKPRNVRRLRRAIEAGIFFMLHFAPPSSTWSMARLPRLRRKGRWILGVPGLRADQLQKVHDGTLLAEATVELALLCLAMGLGFSIENPRSSMIWFFPPMMKLMAMEGVYVVDLVYCGYGAKWMKPTRLLTNVKQLLELACSCT